MYEEKITKMIQKITEESPAINQTPYVLEYMMDFGSCAVSVNLSHN
jgi:hypothetical protein